MLPPPSGTLATPTEEVYGDGTDQEAAMTHPELEPQREQAEALGSRVLMGRSQVPDEPLYVLADPEGHPFCLLVG